MEITCAILQSACFLALAIALPHEKWRRPTTALLGLTIVFCLLTAVFGPAERELVTTHTFVAYQGIDLEPSPVHFPTGEVSAPGWMWPLPFVAFALLGIFGLRWVRQGLPRSPWVLPALFAWGASAAWLGMQGLAAPSVVVQPWGLPRFLWPASLLLTFELARTSDRFWPLMARLVVGIVALRLPLALFSKYASDHHLGTCLDISRVTDIVHPFTRLQFDPPLESGSTEQQFWLIWAEHIFAYPAFHLLSMTGIAFAVFMIRKHDSMED